LGLRTEIGAPPWALAAGIAEALRANDGAIGYHAFIAGPLATSAVAHRRTVAGRFTMTTSARFVARD